MVMLPDMDGDSTLFGQRSLSVEFSKDGSSFSFGQILGQRGFDMCISNMSPMFESRPNLPLE